MCGILGIIGGVGQSPVGLPAAAVRMRDALAHRGPDGWGLAVFERDGIEERSSAAPPAYRVRLEHASRAAVFGHHRLAIIDLSRGGHQPRATPDGRFWITYNGEIYNYRELRAELASAGVRLDSESDTEVLLALYVRDGPACLDRLRGMFAFAVWDDEDGMLFLARDRFGIKPLYHAQTPDGALLFASEPKAITASGLLGAATPAPDAAPAFLRWGYLPPGVTWHQRTRPIPPGHWARWDGRTLLVERWWSVAEAVGEPPRRTAGLAEAGTVVRDALTASVRAHLVSDVPVGVFLSGGLDSTAVLAAAREVHAGPIRTFTVVFPGTSLDESALARAAADRCDTDHAEVSVTADRFLASLDRFFEAMNEPTADGLNTYLVAQAAREAGLTVVMSGLGGDELLGGYDSFLRVPRLHRWTRGLRSIPGAGRLAGRLVTRLPGRRGPKLAALLVDPPSSLAGTWRRYRALFTDAEVRALLGPDAALPPVDTVSRDRVDPFWEIARCEIEEFMTPQLLRDTDVFTMAWGLELRTPFVDHAMLTAVALAGRWPRRRGESFKQTLFGAMGGLLPPAHLARRKQGFVLPLDRWLRSILAGPHPPDDAFAALTREARYRPVVERFLSGRAHWSRPWALYVFERLWGRARTGSAV